MNDMMNDTTGDDAVIARLRSALDEVAAGVDTSAADPDTLGQLAGSSAAPVIALRSGAADRRPGRAWLGVAAATAVLVGAGGWALTQRSTPAATGESTTIAPTPTPSLPGTTNLPWFELRLPDAVAGDEETATTDPQANGFTQSWVVRGRNGDPSSLGVLSIMVEYDQDGLGVTGDASVFTPIDAPNGTAWLHNDPSGASSGGLALVWQRGDGTVWWVTQAGLLDPAGSDAGSFTEYVFQVQRGTFNDLLNNPDEQAEWMGTAPANGIVTRTQNYAVGDDAAGVVLGVASTMLLPALDGTTGITEVAVAGNSAWMGTQPDGQVTVVWLIGPDAWGLLRISPQLADRVDEIIEAVTPVAANVGEPAPAETTLVPVTVPVTDPVTAPAPPVTADAGAQPWFELGLADAEAGTPQSGEFPGVGYSVWQIDDLPTASGPASGNLVLTTLSPEMSATYPTDDPGTVELDGFPEGAATLSGPDADDPNAIVWKRSDGTTWLISQRGLVASGGTLDDQQPFIDLARSLTPGSGVPVVLPSPSATLLGATTSARLANQEYSVGAENCPLEVSVANWPPVVDLAPGETTSDTTILGFPGLMGIAGDGDTVVTWDAGNGWWGELAVASCAADRIDEIIASLVPAVLPASTPAP
jgi:hypothetical protein